MEDLENTAMLSLASKLHGQREALLMGQREPDLFECPDQSIIAMLRQPRSIRDWNDLTTMILQADT